ncbi:MAG: DUF488 domain-containing protein, partial [Alphaproteobacteria bacterium]
MPILTRKSVHDPASPDDGLRLLAMRFWPRGVTKGQADLFLTDLAPSAMTVKEFQAGKLDWPAFVKRYNAEMKAQMPLRKLLAALDRKGTTITLLCGCK